MNFSRSALASVITEVGSPFVLIGALLAVAAARYEAHPWLLASGAIFFIVVVPMVLSWWLAYSRRTTDRYIVRREQRHGFYVASAASFLVGVAFTWFADGSWQLRLIATYALGILLVVAGINLKMKISVHALAAAFTAVCLPVIAGHPGWIAPAVVVALGVPWARVYTQRHSVLEAASGFGLGLLTGSVLCGLLV